MIVIDYVRLRADRTHFSVSLPNQRCTKLFTIARAPEPSVNATYQFRKFVLGSRTAMVVFSCLSLQPNEPIHNPRKLLDELIPNDTEVWLRWKRLVGHKLSTKAALRFTEADWKVDGLNQEERELLEQLLKDAEEAYQGWRDASSSPRPSRSSSTAKMV